MQSENEELFYLVPASYHTMNNPPPNQDNPFNLFLGATIISFGSSLT
jgi:hypothetical protein